MRRLSLALLVTIASACGIPSTGPTMRPGEDCMRCHRGGGEEDAPTFTAAGTVYTHPVDAARAGVRGVRVILTDAGGKTLTLSTNQAGNFYTREPLSFPLRARLEGAGVSREMEHPVPASSGGACNSCHNLPPPVNGDPALTAAGRIALVGGGQDELMLPGDDCLRCHDGSVAKRRFTAAGTVFTNIGDPLGAGVAGATVTLTDATNATVTLTTNAAGNFFTDSPLTFPVTAKLDGAGQSRAMKHAMPHGKCNSCHTVPPKGDAGVPAPLGRIALVGGVGDEFMNPGDDCLSCHDGRQAPAWSVAGTIVSNGAGVAGANVRLLQGGVVKKSLVTNRVGNFFTPDPLPAGRFDIEIVQGGALVGRMSSGEADTSAPLSCNGCHEHRGGARLGFGD